MEGLFYTIIASIVVGIGGLIYKENFVGPKLDVRIDLKNKVWTKREWDFLEAMGRISGEKYKIPEKGDIYDITYEYDITITNNSNVSAHYLKFYYLKEGERFGFLEGYNDEPISSPGSITVKGKFFMRNIEILEYKDRFNYFDNPLKNLKFMVEYTNSHRRKFYTVYNENEYAYGNYYSFFKPKGYVDYSLF